MVGWYAWMARPLVSSPIGWKMGAISSGSVTVTGTLLLDEDELELELDELDTELELDVVVDVE